MCVRVCVCPSQAIHSEIVEVIIVKLDTVTASDVRMHHVLIVLTSPSSKVTQIEIMREKSLIISKTIQATPIKFTVKTVRVKVCVTICQPVR